jgi:hypothetical protein
LHRGHHVGSADVDDLGAADVVEEDQKLFVSR